LIIETRNLRKVFGSKIAVRNLCLNVRPGEIFGFLGPNGAGKSTSIRMLLGLAKPTGGEAFVLGQPAGFVEARRWIGFLPEDFRFYDWLTASELLHLHGRLCGLSDQDLKRRVPEMIDLVGLTPHRDRRLKGFSKGMLQRIGLAQALIHRPRLIILDEPTSGLDPMGRRLVRDILRAERERGATVFLNSHLLSEIEVTCDEVVFIREGEVVTSRDLRTTHDTELTVQVRGRNLPQKALEGLSQWHATGVMENERLILSVPSRDALPEILRHLIAHGSDIYEFTPRPMSLEELFISIVGEDRGL
jgi:ABC-2 type transport system ATP-binding protein